MAADYSKLSQEELIALLQERDAAPAQSADEAMIERAETLATALALRHMQQNAPAQPADDTLYPVTNVCGAALAFTVTDERNGAKRAFLLERRGESAKLTRGQVEELQMHAPHFFKNGLLSVPALVEDNANVIRDYPAFLEAIPYNGVSAAINQINSVPVLYDLFNHIESMRFTDLDENGRKLTERDDVTGRELPAIREVEDFDPKLIAVELAIKKRVAALTGVSLSLDA